MELLIKDSSLKIKYRDTIFRIILPFLAAHYSLAINEPESFLEFIQLPQYPLMLIQNWVFVSILVNIIYYVTLYLDKRFPWYKGKNKRLILQLAIGVMLPSFLALLLAFGFFKINGIDIFETNYLKLEWWFSILFILIVNCYYIIYYFVSLLVVLKNQKASSGEVSVKEWILLQGSNRVKVSESDIAIFYHRDGINFAQTFDDEQFIVEGTLAEIMSIVDKARFFMVIRSFIVNRDAIKSFTPASSGRLRIYSHCMENEEVYVSQRNAQEFKKWFSYNLL